MTTRWSSYCNECHHCVIYLAGAWGGIHVGGPSAYFLAFLQQKLTFKQRNSSILPTYHSSRSLAPKFCEKSSFHNEVQYRFVITACHFFALFSQRPVFFSTAIRCAVHLHVYMWHYWLIKVASCVRCWRHFCSVLLIRLANAIHHVTLGKKRGSSHCNWEKVHNYTHIWCSYRLTRNCVENCYCLLVCYAKVALILLPVL